MNSGRHASLVSITLETHGLVVRRSIHVSNLPGNLGLDCRPTLPSCPAVPQHEFG